jgi:hypothetical protein
MSTRTFFLVHSQLCLTRQRRRVRPRGHHSVQVLLMSGAVWVCVHVREYVRARVRDCVRACVRASERLALSHP